MIRAIVFSKDRACQLQLFLESVQKNASGVFDMHIIIKASTEEFKAGYDKISGLFPDIKFIEQSSDIKKDILDLLVSNCAYSCFFTDDDIIYGQVKEEDIISNISSDEDVFCFSLRLGENIKFCYTMNMENVLHNQEDLGEFIKWDWTLHYLDLGYPLSVDGHIFRTQEITKLTKKVSFKNPNEFEGNLQIFDNFPRPKMAAYKHSALVNAPNNIVNDTHPNRNATEHGITTKELNDRLLKGEKIDFDALDFSNIIGAHQELKYKFTHAK